MQFLPKYKFLLFLPLLALATGCQSDLPTDNYIELPEGDASVNFNATVKESKAVSNTRALSQEPEPVRQVDFPNNFYIRMKLDKGENLPPDVAEATADRTMAYIVPPGSQAYLRYKDYDFSVDSHQGLNWGDAVATYNFWSWTTPWQDVFNKPQTTDPDPDSNPDPDTDIDSGDEQDVENTPVINLEPQKVTIENSSLNQMSSPSNNMAYLEQFIGSKSGPYSYKSTGNGEVDLQYRHLVSKIIITRFTLIDMYGEYQDGQQATIKFLNMPTSFTFYPCPNGEKYIDAQGETQTLPVGGAPVAVADFANTGATDGPTFAINNKGQYDSKGNLIGGDLDMFYICPEIDFSKVEFMVEMVNEKYNQRGAYFGSFQDVISFERLDSEGKPVDYDNADGESDKYVLHAGEVMEFNLIVKEIGGSGIGITIHDWAAHTMAEAEYHPHKGFYGDISEARDLFKQSKSDTYKGQVNNLYDLYGDGNTRDEDPETVPEYFEDLNIFRLYGDATVTKTSANATNGMDFPLWDGYDYTDEDGETHHMDGFILDGMGYTLTFQPPGNDPNAHTITVGKMRDIYLTDGTYTVYVDSQGCVWVLNLATGNYDMTEQKLDKTSNKIDLKALTDAAAKG